MILYETERLIIRQWENKKSDIDDLYKMASDKVTNTFVVYPLYTSRDDAIKRIHDVREKYRTGYKLSDQDYAIELKENNRVIGSIAIMNYTDDAQGRCELGYQLSSEFFHKCYMPEAVKEMINYIFSHNMASRIQAKHDINNPNSGKVMQKAGMTKEGVLRKYSSNNNSNRADTAMYSILIEEWKEK